jgi:hypothetical protein
MRKFKFGDLLRSKQIHRLKIQIVGFSRESYKIRQVEPEPGPLVVDSMLLEMAYVEEFYSKIENGVELFIGCL